MIVSGVLTPTETYVKNTNLNNYITYEPKLLIMLNNSFFNVRNKILGICKTNIEPSRWHISIYLLHNALSYDYSTNKEINLLYSRHYYDDYVKSLINSIRSSLGFNRNSLRSHTNILTHKLISDVSTSSHVAQSTEPFRILSGYSYFKVNHVSDNEYNYIGEYKSKSYNGYLTGGYNTDKDSDKIKKLNHFENIKILLIELQESGVSDINIFLLSNRYYESISTVVFEGYIYHVITIEPKLKGNCFSLLANRYKKLLEFIFPIAYSILEEVSFESDLYRMLKDKIDIETNKKDIFKKITQISMIGYIYYGEATYSYTMKTGGEIRVIRKSGIYIHFFDTHILITSITYQRLFYELIELMRICYKNLENMLQDFLSKAILDQKTRVVYNDKEGQLLIE